MKAIFFKEIRENLKWAGLILIALSILLGLAITTPSSSGFNLVGRTVQAATQIGFAAAGAVLGLLQILQDAPRGRFTFVTHRPISRTRLFFAKAMAGVILYFLAAGIPLVGMIVYAAMPGKLGQPFCWQMILPTLCDLLGGVMWFVASLHVASRSARWYGTRITPFAVALTAAFLMQIACITFTEAIGVIVLALLILVPAAWGSYVAGGQHERQPVISRFMQTVAVGWGTVLFSFVAVCGAYEGLRDLFTERQAYNYSSYWIDINGHAMIGAYSNNRTVMNDLDGHVIPRPWTSLRMQYLSASANAENDSSRTSKVRSKGFREQRTYGWELSSDNSSHWFYVAPKRIIECFDFKTRRRVGGFGPSGFTAAPQEPVPFPEPMDRYADPEHRVPSGPMLVGATTVYALAGDHLSEILKTTPDDPILDCGQMNAGSDINSAVQEIHLVILTRSGLHIIGPNLNSHIYVPLEAVNEFQYGRIVVGKVIGGSFYLVVGPDYGSLGSSVLLEVNGNGEITKRTNLPALPQRTFASPPLWQDLAVAAVLPPVLSLHKWMFDLQEGVCILMGVVSAFTTFFICRRYVLGRRSQILWAILGLLIGVSAVLILLAVRTLPVRITCPACAKRRVITRDLCEHCGATFPPPADEGIGIIEVAV